MNILIIASDIGVTAPGIVYQTLINNIKKYHSVSIISPKLSENFDYSDVKLIPCIKSPYRHPRIETLFFKLCGRPIIEDIWAKRQLGKLSLLDLQDIDVIFSMVSSGHYLGAIMGYELSIKYKKKWFLYSVDAIPAPMGWIDDVKYYNKCRKFISEYIKKTDAFFSSNPQMLEYMSEPLKEREIKTGVIYTPIRDFYNIQPSIINSSINFLFTGGIYGPRKKESVLDGFRLFLKKHPTATFTFVGHYHETTFKGYEDLMNQGSLLVKGYTTDLFGIYKTASVLVDINAYFDNDVFLSSKIINYLPINKPIISVTGNNSPSRNLFVTDPTIIHCYHNPEEVLSAMEKAVMLQNINMDYRKEYVDLLSAQSVLSEFYELLASF